MFGRRSNTLLTVSVGTLAAAVLGVQLGQSAIGAIHPAYFEGEPLPPRAVDGRERPVAEPAFYQAYNFEQGAAARAIECGDNCGRPAAYDPYAYWEPAPRVIRAGLRDQPEAPPELEPWPPGQVSDAPRPSVTRFADFPIEEKPEPEDDQGERRADYQRGDVFED